MFSVSRAGGTTGAIITCPLEVVKTRLQSSNSGFGSGDFPEQKRDRNEKIQSKTLNGTNQQQQQQHEKLNVLKNGSQNQQTRPEVYFTKQHAKNAIQVIRFNNHYYISETFQFFILMMSQFFNMILNYFLTACKKCK